MPSGNGFDQLHTARMQFAGLFVVLPWLVSVYFKIDGVETFRLRLPPARDGPFGPHPWASLPCCASPSSSFSRTSPPCWPCGISSGGAVSSAGRPSGTTTYQVCCIRSPFLLSHISNFRALVLHSSDKPRHNGNRIFWDHRVSDHCRGEKAQFQLAL